MVDFKAPAIFIGGGMIEATTLAVDYAEKKVFFITKKLGIKTYNLKLKNDISWIDDYWELENVKDGRTKRSLRLYFRDPVTFEEWDFSGNSLGNKMKVMEVLNQKLRLGLGSLSEHVGSTGLPEYEEKLTKHKVDFASSIRPSQPPRKTDGKKNKE